MPADLFLKLGNVKGESVDLKHAGEMELLSPPVSIVLSA